MAIHLRFLLILTGLTGIYSITTVHKMSVKHGDSITIPCLYDSQYKNHVKYLCKGYYWLHCSYVIKTNQDSSKFSISDDKNKQIFTVTIKDLSDKDTDYYWCAVEIHGGADVEESFHLSVTRGTPSLYVDHQEITGFNGDSITITCHNRNSRDMKWCRLGSSCVTGPSGSIDRTGVTTDVTTHNVYTVTMSGLREESSGWYLCVNGDLQMPVHLTVTEKPSTTTLATTTGLTTFSATSEPVTLTSVIGNKALTTVQCEQHIASVDLKSFIIPLSLLSFSVTVALLIWFMLKKQKQTKEAAAPSITEPGEEAIYCNIQHMSNYSSQRTYTESDMDVIYSSVVTIRQQSVQRVKPSEDNVIYSKLA